MTMVRKRSVLNAVWLSGYSSSRAETLPVESWFWWSLAGYVGVWLAEAPGSGFVKLEFSILDPLHCGREAL